MAAARKPPTSTRPWLAYRCMAAPRRRRRRAARWPAPRGTSATGPLSLARSSALPLTVTGWEAAARDRPVTAARMPRTARIPTFRLRRGRRRRRREGAMSDTEGIVETLQALREARAEAGRLTTALDEAGAAMGRAIVVATFDTLDTDGPQPVEEPHHAVERAVWDLVRERDEARASLARVTEERDAARCAEAESHSELVLARSDLVCVRHERDEALARLCDADSYRARYNDHVAEVARLREEGAAARERGRNEGIEAVIAELRPYIGHSLNSGTLASLRLLRAPSSAPSPADDPGECVRCGDGSGGVCPHGCTSAAPSPKEDAPRCEACAD